MAVGAIIAAVAAVAGAIITYTGQRKAAKKIAAAEKETRAVQSAASKIENARNRRRAIRERRIVAARIKQSAENSGVGGSSGEFGATSVAGVNLGDVLGIDSSRSLTAEGISEQQQRISDARRRGNAAAALGSLVATVGAAVGSAMGAPSGGSLPSSGGSTRMSPSGSVRGFQYGVFGGGV